MMRVPADRNGLRSAAAALHADQVVAYPTETVYGLGANPFSETALDRLFAVKQRDPVHPVLLIIGSIQQLAGLTQDPSEAVQQCMKTFWPGPLSLVLPAARHVPDRLLGADGHICVRLPGCAVARTLCLLCGGPITSTSANLSGLPPARTPQDAALPGVCLLVDGGPSANLAPSTVFHPASGRILRSGAVTPTMLRKAGIEVQET